MRLRDAEVDRKKPSSAPLSAAHPYEFLQIEIALAGPFAGKQRENPAQERRSPVFSHLHIDFRRRATALKLRDEIRR
jgi:hypothetical protein